MPTPNQKVQEFVSQNPERAVSSDNFDIQLAAFVVMSETMKVIAYLNISRIQLPKKI